MEKPIPIMIRLLHSTAAALLLCCLLLTTGLLANSTPNPCLDEWEEGAFPPSYMAAMTVNCPLPVILSLPSTGCTVTLDLEEPTADCPILSITNDFNGMASIPEQEFGEINIEIVWTVTTECDGEFICTQSVFIDDNTAPIFVCPSSASEQCSADDMVPFADIDELVAAGAIITDNCQLDSTYLLAGDPILVDAGPCPMIFERTYTVRDTSGNEAMCMHTIFVNDTTNPVFTCPANITVSTDAATCMAEIEVPDVDVTDNCGDVTLTNTLAANPGDIIMLPIGDTPVKYYAEDACGNIDSCETMITVLDATAPMMTCPPNGAASCDVSEVDVFASYADFTAAGGSATDNCGTIDEMSFAFVSASSNNMDCPETVTRIYSVADDSGNIATCEHAIIISENEAPTFTTPLDTIVDCGANIDTMNVGAPIDVMDNCGSGEVTLSFTYGPEVPGECPVLYTITRSWTATDLCGNTSAPQDQIITVQDTIQPIAVCKMDTIYLDEFGDATLNAEDLDGGSIDGCGSGNLTFTSDFDFASCNDATLMQDIVLTVTDACGNSDTCMTSVLVLDTLPAMLTCPPNMMVVCPSDVPEAFMTFAAFESAGGDFDDNCQNDDPSSFMMTNEVEDGTTCPYNILRTYVAEDNNGNSDSCVHIITVTDITLPVINCPADMMIVGGMNTCDTLLTIPLATATDACGIASISNDFNGGGADASGTYPGGVTVVTFTAIDECGNMSTCQMTITVEANPALACPEDLTVQCDLTEEPIFTSFAQFVDAGGSANLGCGADTTGFAHMGDILISTNSCTQVYERTYGLPGMMGDMFECSYLITVTDDEAPMITCPVAININAALDQCTANVDLNILVTDNCGSVTLTNDFTTETSGDFPVGTTTVTFTATDDCDNVATCMLDITVVDAQAPYITCPDGAVAMCDPSMVPVYNTYTAFLNADASSDIDDNCAIDTTTFAYEGEMELTIFGMTIINRTYSIEDSVGNASSCVQTIIVMDSTNPFVTCPDDVTVDADAGLCTAMVTGLIATTGDNCLVDTIYNSRTGDGPDASDVYPVGETLVTFTVEDEEGNSSQCSFTVTVVDNILPVLTCPADLALAECGVDDNDAYTSFLAFQNAGGMAEDICGIDTSTFTLVSDVEISGTDPCLVTHERTYSIEDNNGNVGTCTQMYSTEDTTPPTLTCPEIISLSTNPGVCFATTILEISATDFCSENVLVTNDYYDLTELPFVGTLDSSSPVWTRPFGQGSSCVPSSVGIDVPYQTHEFFVVTGGDSDFENVSFTAPSSDFFMALYEDSFDPTMPCTNMIINNDDGVGLLSQFDVLLESSVQYILVATTFDNSGDDFGDYVVELESDAMLTDTEVTFPEGETTIVFTATDDCGLSSTCEVVITVTDDEDPVVSFLDIPSAQDTVEVMCDLADAVAIIDFDDLLASGGQVTDNCMVDELYFNQLSPDVLVTGSDPVMYVRSYQVADQSGNFDTLEQIIIVQDTDLPTVAAPADITVDCDTDISDLSITGEPITNDNCMAGGLDLEVTDEASVLTCPNDSLILRIFTVMDDAGNTAIDTQEIYKIDSEAPVFDTDANLFAMIPTMIDDTIACSADFPAPIMAIAQDACGETSIVIDTLPILPTICSGYQVTYRYIASDDCMNSDTVYSAFWVSRDTTAPEVTVLDTFVNLTTDPDLCTASATLPIPTVLDDCSEYVIVNSIDGEDTLTAVFPLGETTFSYTISDDCGNITVVDQTVIVEDEEAPEITCRTTPIQVSVSSDMSMVLANSFVLDATDNCGYTDVQVRRLNDLCGIDGNETLGDTIFFCCEDVGAIHEIEVIVTDEAGNQNSCVALAEVSDNVKPSFLIPIPDVTVSCDYPLDLEDMSEFGTFVLTGEDRADIIINDTAYVNTDGLVGQDGVFKENCPMGTMVTTNVIDMTTNGQGIINRIFTITDASGNEATYTQRIFVEDFNPFSEEDITWPEDITVEGCESDIPTLAQGGVPTFTNINKCHEIQYSHSDLVFDNPTSGCVYVRRTFKVIDSNIYDPNGDPDEGIWTRIQDLFMTNSVDPEFTEACSDTLICAQGSGCSALVELSVEATDDCTDSEDLEYEYAIDTNNDGTTDITGVSNSISEILPQGMHEITFTVYDRCGNSATCTRVVEVKECKPPSVVCVALALDLSPIDGTIQIWASDFVVSSSDNCTDAEDLIYSFSSDPAEFGRTFNCDSLGIREVQIWATDEAGNQDFCMTTVDVQDNQGACNDGLNQNTSVNGLVATTNNVPVTNATVVLEGAETFFGIITDDQGEYVFHEVPMYNDYTVTPSKDDEHLNGVSTLDLVLIQRHILQLDEFDSPYNIIAADINGSEKVSAADVVELRKLILGVQEGFNSNNSFRFVESNYEFADEEDPFPFMEEKEFQEVNSTGVHTNFIAVKIGDVNGSIEDGLTSNGNVEVRSDKVVSLFTEDQFLKAGETVIIPIYTNSISSLAALQYTLNYDRDFLEFVSADGGQIALDNNHVADHTSASKTTVAWSTFEAIENISTSEPLTYFAYNVKRNGKLSEVLSISSEITEAIVYDGDYERHDIELRFDEASTPGFAMFQNQPNPFTEYTEIVFELPKAEEVSLQVFDNAGKLVHKQSSTYTAGKHQIRLNTDQLTKSGVYYYKIKAGEYSDARKMLKIK